MAKRPKLNGPSLQALCHQAPVIPQLEIGDIAHAVPLAEALVAGGLGVLEVMVRSEIALEAIRLIARVPGAAVGAGGIMTGRDASAAQMAGALYASSPGSTHFLADSCEDMGLPFLPAAATATEAMRLAERGYEVMGFYPARSGGGPDVLADLADILPQVHFRPAGGITAEAAPAYLHLPNVPCVAGSWLSPPKLIAEERWNDLRALAHNARRLSGRTGAA